MQRESTIVDGGVRGEVIRGQERCLSSSSPFLTRDPLGALLLTAHMRYGFTAFTRGQDHLPDINGQDGRVQKVSVLPRLEGVNRRFGILKWKERDRGSLGLGEEDWKELEVKDNLDA